MWRVVKYPHRNAIGMYEYRVMNCRRIYSRFVGSNAQEAIESACRFALGCSISIFWGTAQ